MSPAHPFLPGLAEKVAVGAVLNLLKASALGIQRRLGRIRLSRELSIAPLDRRVSPSHTPRDHGGRSFEVPRWSSWKPAQAPPAV